MSIFPYFTVQPGDHFHNTSYELKTLKDNPVSFVLISSVMASWKDELKEEVILVNIKSDVWLTVHRDSVWIRKTN